MKLSFAATSLALAALTYRGESFIPSPPTFSPRVVVATASSSYLSMSETVEAAAAEGSKTAVAKSNANSKKNKRLDMFRNPQFFRRGFKEERVGVEETMGLEYQSTLVDEMKASENVLRRDGVTAHLAKVRFDERREEEDEEARRGGGEDGVFLFLFLFFLFFFAKEI